MDDRLPLVGALLPDQLEYRLLKVLILVHFPYHLIILLVIEYDLPYGVGRGSLELD